VFSLASTTVAVMTEIAVARINKIVKLFILLYWMNVGYCFVVAVIVVVGRLAVGYFVRRL